MYGTIMRATVKAGQRQAFEEVMRSMAPDSSTGFHSAEVAWEDRDPNRLLMVVHFRDRESYLANASTPQTDSEYRRMVEYLDGEPEWIDVHYTEYVGAALSEAAVAGATG